MRYFVFVLFIACALASEGDKSPHFITCVRECCQLLQCDKYDGTKSIQNNNDLKALTYNYEDFTSNAYSVGFVSRYLFRWDCQSNCKYTCIQLDTNERIARGESITQYFGKWPFIRIFGITELFSVIFSLANFWACYINVKRIKSELNKNSKNSATKEYATMYLQYLVLLYISLIGWTFSTIFHIRDVAITETLDYFGAIAIIICNFNVIAIRFFKLYKDKNNAKRALFQFCLAMIYLIHCAKLLRKWDYGYNIKFSVFFGSSAIVLWTLHSLKLNKEYQSSYQVYNNSIQLLPCETKLLAKLNLFGFVSKTRKIPLIPIYLNIILLFGMLLEVFDFHPIFRLIDAHSIWHFTTIFPSLIWYDWNIWDIELEKLQQVTNKLS